MFFSCHLQPLHRELYNLVPRLCFVPSFLKAINENTEDSFRSIISEASPGVFVFDMLLPSFCEMMLAEVICNASFFFLNFSVPFYAILLMCYYCLTMQIDNFEKWVAETKFKIMRPNTMNKYGAVLDDFGLDTMLDKLMECFIRPISKGNI